MKKVILKKNEERRINLGHIWIFSNEIKEIIGDVQSGDIVQVFDSRNSFIANGFYNKSSLISVRVLNKETEINFPNLLSERINNAYKLRKLFYPNRKSFRLVFSESDYLPGLIIDKFNSTFVLQVYSFGMNNYLDEIFRILKNDFNAENIFTNNDEYFRKLEGLDIDQKILLGSDAVEEIINDGKVNYHINFKSTQKTGFFFDQCDNREFLGKLANGKKYLDLFCNSGGFGLHAALNGAKEIMFVDSSKSEIENVKRNYHLNNFESNVGYTESEAFEFMKEINERNEKYDIVNIDPPAFAKNKKSLSNAIKGYERINSLAINATAVNGLFATSSCSHHLNEQEFFRMILRAVNKSNRKIQLLHFNGASLDHPSLPSMDETKYLKFALFKLD